MTTIFRERKYSKFGDMLSELWIQVLITTKLCWLFKCLHMDLGVYIYESVRVVTELVRAVLCLTSHTKWLKTQKWPSFWVCPQAMRAPSHFQCFLRVSSTECGIWMSDIHISDLKQSWHGLGHSFRTRENKQQKAAVLFLKFWITASGLNNSVQDHSGFLYFMMPSNLTSALLITLAWTPNTFHF